MQNKPTWEEVHKDLLLPTVEVPSPHRDGFVGGGAHREVGGARSIRGEVEKGPLVEDQEGVCMKYLWGHLVALLVVRPLEWEGLDSSSPI